MSGVDLSNQSLKDLTGVIATLVQAEVETFNRSLRELTDRFNEKLSAVEQKLADAEQKLADTDKLLDDERKTSAQLRDIVEKNGENLNTAEDNIDWLQREVEKKEQYGRRMNIRFQNIEYDPRETEISLLDKLIKALSDVDITIEKRDIVRIHRLGKPKTQDGVTTMQTIAKFGYWAPRQLMSKVNQNARRKNDSLRAHNDLTSARFQALKYAQTKCSREQKKRFTEDELKNLRDEQKVFAYSTPNCDLRLRCNGHVFKFADEDEFDGLFDEHFTYTK